MMTSGYRVLTWRKPSRSSAPQMHSLEGQDQPKGLHPIGHVAAGVVKQHEDDCWLLSPCPQGAPGLQVGTANHPPLRPG